MAAYEISAEGVQISHTVKLTKDAVRSLRDDKVAAQIEAIIAGTSTAQRTARGWKITRPDMQLHREYKYTNAIEGAYNYFVTLDVICNPNKPRPSIPAEFQTILNSIDTKAALTKWKISDVDGKPYAGVSVADMSEAMAGNVGYAPLEIPGNWSEHFSHLYGLDSHINRIRRALDAAVISDWRNRVHVALIGPPGCGKSDICQSVKRALGEESVLEFDATSTTMAGAQKELTEREELPRVLLVEEIEKAPVNSMSWLLSALDLRGEIRKTTARGNILRDTRMLCIATVNDVPTFKAVSFGALESRFSNKVHFQRPPREMLSRILAREIEKINGNMEWIKPTLDYAEEIGTSDPREIIAIGICGREALMDGSYQTDLRNTRAEMPTANGWETQQ